MAQDKNLAILRHSAAHLLAQAVSELFPKTKMTIGPATTHGFFYDFQPETNFKEADITIISERMSELANKNLDITHEEISKEKAREIYKDNPFKLELIDGIEGDTVGFSKQGDFYDLCRGGHVKSTGLLKNFVLTNISGSYWRADRDGVKLQRITGTAFATPKELRMYLKRKEEAAKYDHRKLGKEMGLFSFHEEGAGFPFYHPRGKQIYNNLENLIKKIWKENGYQEISTPMMLDAELWKQSGHYQHYKDNMYFCEIDDRDYAVKPMNCPGAITIYKEKPHSFRELPLKLAEFGNVHRYELSGVLHGLFRARAFTIDDAHIFCSPQQVEDEVINIVNIIDATFKFFNFDKVTYAISTKPDNAMGTDEYWTLATDGLINALKKTNKEYVLQEGEGAFYGPKIEVTIEDSMQRKWQCSTVQIDFFQPQNFDITYIESGGAKKQPVMIHQALLGSLERFMGIVLEHSKGHLPFWMAPTQIKVLPITEDQKEYAQSIVDTLSAQNLRVELDSSSDPLSAKIKVAQLAKVPWMLVVGHKEQDNQVITLRYANGKQEFGLTLDQLIEKAAQ